MALSPAGGAVLQARLLPETRSAANRLPGTRPLEPADWLVTDDAHAAQMALRDMPVSERRSEVIALDPGARPAALELLETVLRLLAARSDHAVRKATVRDRTG